MRTSININRHLSEKLESTSIDLNISTDDLIVLLLDAFRLHANCDISFTRGVRYQNCDPERNWRCFHITLNQWIYEFCLDLKKIYKFSLSFIISFAIISFLDKIIIRIKSLETKNEKLDNYLKNYLFITNNFDNIQGVIIFWGIPTEKSLRNLLP